ncbi:MAG: HigA family addiction module antitoxin [Acidobacteriota bacterium]
MITTSEKRFEMHDPPHPGEVLRELYLEPVGITVTEAARRLGVTRKTLSELVNGRAGLSPEMAIRIGAATKSTPESWLNMQMHYDLWQRRKMRKKLKVRRLVPFQLVAARGNVVHPQWRSRRRYHSPRPK